MSRVRLAALIVLCVPVLAGCVVAPRPTATVTVPEASPTITAAATETPVASTTSATPVPPATPTAVPLTNALDVKQWPNADFASPSGRIWCDVAADQALCHFPNNYKGTIPGGNQICPGEGLDVTGVIVTSAETKFGIDTLRAEIFVLINT